MRSPVPWIRVATLFALALAASCGGSGGSGGGGSGSGAPLFAKTYGGLGFDRIGDAAETPDGGFVVVGSYGGRVVGERVREEDLWITKLDIYGDVEWSRALAHEAGSAYLSPVSLARPVAPVPSYDGGFFVASDRVDQPGNVPTEATHDVGLTRMDAAGMVAWTSNFGIAAPLGSTYLTPSLGGFDTVHAVTATRDGGAVVAGRTRANMNVSGSVINTEFGWAVKVDATGTPLWTRYLTDDVTEQTSLDPSGMHAVTTRQGAVYVTEQSSQQNVFMSTVGRRTRVVRIEPDGTVSWTEDIDNFFATELSLALAPLPLGDDGPLMVGNDIGTGLNSDGQQGVVMDALGNTLFRRDYDFDRIDSGAGELAASAGDVAYQFVGAPLGSLATYTDTSLRVIRVDRDGEPVAGTGDVVADLRFARATRLDKSATPFRFDLFGSRVGMYIVDPTTPAVILSGEQGAPSGTTFDTATELPFRIPVRPSSSFPTEFCGWMPDSDRTWTWLRTPGEGNQSFTLSLREANGSEVWSRDFSSMSRRRMEQAVDVEILSQPGPAENWQIVVYGRSDVDITGGPEHETDVPWLVVLDSDAQIISETALRGARLGRGNMASEAYRNGGGSRFFRDTGSMALTPDGDALVWLEVDEMPRIAKVNLSSGVEWCSAPIAAGTPDQIAGVVALRDGGAVGVSGNSIARFDEDGQVIWRREVSSPMLVGIAEGVDGRLGVLGYSPASSFSITPGDVHFDLVDLDGQHVSRTVWELPTVLRFRFGAGLIATRDGGFVAQGVRSLPAGLTPSLQQWTNVLEVFKFDSSGAPQWCSSYGGLRHEFGNSVSETGDGGLLVTGQTESVTESMDAWFLRLDSCGRVGPLCAAEFERTESNFEFQQAALPAGTFYPAVQIPAGLDTPGTLSTVMTSAEVQTLTEFEITRQCSGASKDPSAPPNGSFYPLQISIGSGSGTVEEVVATPAVPSIVCSSTCTYYLTPGTMLTLRATPDPGFDPAVWSGGDCGSVQSEECTVTMNGPRTVVVNFGVPGGGGGSYEGLYDLTIVVAGSGDGRVFVDPPGIYCDEGCVLEDLAAPGDSVFVRAIPSPGSNFGGFTGVDDVDGMVGEVRFGMSDRTVTVRFD